MIRFLVVAALSCAIAHADPRPSPAPSCTAELKQLREELRIARLNEFAIRLMCGQKCRSKIKVDNGK